MAVNIQSATPLFLVYDVPTSLAFYRDLLGFEVVSTSVPFSSAKDDVGWVMLRLNGVELMLNNMYENNVRPETPDAVRAAGHRDIILYLSCSDLDTTRTYLLEHNCPVKEPHITYYGMRQMNLSDPDGYSLCFQWPVKTTTHTHS